MYTLNCKVVGGPCRGGGGSRNGIDGSGSVINGNLIQQP